MSTQKPNKSLKTPNATLPPSTRSPSSSLFSHLAMVELKQRILTSLSKLADRDTYQIAVEDLEKTIQSICPETLPLLLNCLYDSCNDPKPAVKKESLRLFSFVCQFHADLAFAHLTKIVSNIVKRLKDGDSGVRDACRDAIGSLSGIYLKGREESNGGVGAVVGLFVKPLFEAMGEQNKGVQSGAAMCMAKVVDCAEDPPIAAFQKLCPRICKLLNNPNFLAKASLFPVVASLSQVGAIAPQSLEILLQCMHECLGSTDWATRKAAADALISLASHSSDLVKDKAESTLTVLEACRFDKIKPVRECMTEALQLWKKIAGKSGEGAQEEQKTSPESLESEKNGVKKSDHGDRTEPLTNDLSDGSHPDSDSVSKGKAGGIMEKAAGVFKKKGPGLSDKEVNPEFFQKLHQRGSDDLPVEVVVPRSCLNSSNDSNEEGLNPNDFNSRRRSNRFEISNANDHDSFNPKVRNLERTTAGVHTKQRDNGDFAQEKLPEERVNGKDARRKASDDDRADMDQREPSGDNNTFSKTDSQCDGTFTNNKGNWSAIQRQLMQLERQQAHLMNMLQDFMGGSTNSMLTLENRVRGLERVVEDMARDLSISSGRRGNFGVAFEGPNRSISKYNGLPDYLSTKYSSHNPFGERYQQSDGVSSGVRGRGPTWRSDASDDWEFSGYASSRNGQFGSRRALAGGALDVRSPKSDHDGDHAGGNRRAWDKGAGRVRLGEGPSARSVWQASKDEATLEAIRVAGDDIGTSRAARVAVPERTAEAMGDDNVGQERDPIWTCWSNAMHALQVGDMDVAYAEVMDTNDDVLLVKLMDKTGPVIDQLSNEIANEVLQALGQFLLDQNLFDICLCWIQQLVEMVLENGADLFGINIELKKELLLNLNEASATMDTPDDWEGPTPDQLLMQLASIWGIKLQQFAK